jgi:hypothetical protein
VTTAPRTDHADHAESAAGLKGGTMRPQWTVLIGIAGVAAAVLWREMPTIRRYLKMARM